jgi:FkbM family methyltransferase
MASLDSFLESAGAARINLIKIDMEGFEIDVFAGVKKTLGQYQPGILREIYS